MKHKTIQQLRDNLKRVLKRARQKQLKKLRKAYHGKRLKKWWSDYANADGCNTIAELKDFEGVGHRMKGGKRHNHIYNACRRITFRSKNERHRVSREDKRFFTATFYTSLMHNLVTLGDILKRRKA
jgi:hypothetical protein